MLDWTGEFSPACLDRRVGRDTERAHLDLTLSRPAA